jgi:hypothetical protein
MSNAASTQTPATEHRCLRPGCGRKLTSAKSVAAGYGPVCLRKIRQAQLDEARADFTPEQAAKADELIRDGGIIAQAPGLFEAVSSKGDGLYATDGRSCTCPAGAKDRRCYHLLAARVLTIASRRSYAKAA